MLPEHKCLLFHNVVSFAYVRLVATPYRSERHAGDRGKTRSGGEKHAWSGGGLDRRVRQISGPANARSEASAAARCKLLAGGERWRQPWCSGSRSKRGRGADALASPPRGPEANHGAATASRVGRGVMGYYAGDPGFFSVLRGIGRAAAGMVPGVGGGLSRVIGGLGSRGPSTASPRVAGVFTGIMRTTPGAVVRHPALAA